MTELAYGYLMANPRVWLDPLEFPVLKVIHLPEQRSTRFLLGRPTSLKDWEGISEARPLRPGQIVKLSPEPFGIVIQAVGEGFIDTDERHIYDAMQAVADGTHPEWMPQTLTRIVQIEGDWRR